MRGDQPRGGRPILADRAGNVVIEFALALPLLLLLLVGMFDLGRLAYDKTAMLQGARAGAQYAILDPDSTAAIEATAVGATGLSGVIAASTKFCECVAGTEVPCTTTCGSGETLKTYVRVTTTKSFTSVLNKATVRFGSYSVWTPPTSVMGSVTMVVP